MIRELKASLNKLINCFFDESDNVFLIIFNRSFFEPLLARVRGIVSKQHLEMNEDEDKFLIYFSCNYLYNKIADLKVMFFLQLFCYFFIYYNISSTAISALVTFLITYFNPIPGFAATLIFHFNLETTIFFQIPTIRFLIELENQKNHLYKVVVRFFIQNIKENVLDLGSDFNPHKMENSKISIQEVKNASLKIKKTWDELLKEWININRIAILVFAFIWVNCLIFLILSEVSYIEILKIGCFYLAEFLAYGILLNLALIITGAFLTSYIIPDGRIILKQLIESKFSSKAITEEEIEEDFFLDVTESIFNDLSSELICELVKSSILGIKNNSYFEKKAKDILKKEEKSDGESFVDSRIAEILTRVYSESTLNQIAHETEGINL